MYGLYTLILHGLYSESQDTQFLFNHAINRRLLHFQSALRSAGGVAGDSFLRGRVILAALIGTAISTVWLACSESYTSLLVGKVHS